jgi:hypothetical protein
MAIVALSVAGSTAPVIRIRALFANSTSIRPGDGKPAGAAPAQPVPPQTPLMAAAAAQLPSPPIELARMNARFPRYRRDAGPGSSEADTSRSFSAALQRRRAAPR